MPIVLPTQKMGLKQPRKGCFQPPALFICLFGLSNALQNDHDDQNVMTSVTTFGEILPT